ncbi:hypothetical protein Q428_10795 [Fervidicella metallireducens AeB]|uniref:Ppx/GppA phosphatase N-terminal domain-containing protein n=1 Tax=Fervidicella metallireducens AeB TaxID=1403537 RepID=A0A017RT31_9CLOT|nr:rod shape-determining protein [Fervidicella metallireducens]EYE87918.1 hypothetical protein Q428_10795 [Fervidicella metallireducens AeB]
MDRIGAIELGTNSTRLLIADINEDAIHPLVKKSVTTRLGYRIDETGLICESSLERTLKAIKEYQNIMKEYGVTRGVITATSAVRDAKNKNEVIKIIEKESGIQTFILSGEEEAYLGYVGVRTIVHSSIPTLVIDIGGGSTEFILGVDNKILYRKSVNIGCVRLSEKFISEYPVQKNIIESIGNYTLEKIASIIDDIKNMAAEFNLYAIGGTATTLAAVKYGIANIEGSKLYEHNISNFINDYSLLDKISMEKVAVIEQGRHDIILAGAIILEVIMKALGYSYVTISTRDSLEGAIYYLKNYM